MRATLTLSKIRYILTATSRHIKNGLPNLKRIKTVNKTLFSQKHILATNVFISVFTSGVGDLIEQLFEILDNVQATWNKTRTLKLATTGVSLGFLAHYWYKLMDDRKWTSIWQKILLSQLVYSPICLVAFFLTLGLLNKSSQTQIVEDILSKGKRIYQAEWMIWPIAGFINFKLVPLRYRILFDSVVSLGFDVYNSYVVYR
jgi:protein Mpv17